MNATFETRACAHLLTQTRLGGALGYPKLGGLCLTAASAVGGGGQERDGLSGEKGASRPRVAFLGRASDFKVISCAELGLLGLTCLHLRSRPPISAPFPHSLCIRVSARSEASPPDRDNPNLPPSSGLEGCIPLSARIFFFFP